MKMCSTPVHCPKCGGNDVKSFGYSVHNVPRYFCCNAECETKSFMLEYRYKAYEPGVKEKIVDMAINGGGIRDTSRVLGINKKTVINTLKKEKGLVQVNPNIQKMDLGTGAVIHVGRACQEAEIDEQWSYVFEKSNQRWLWHAVDHATNTVLAYVFGKRKDEVFKKLKELLEPFGIKKFYTDDWGGLSSC
ncbi:IS1 family transposase [Endozoicomonas gorgoniicola]|uniref:IS1 family transposase n=1 Tax=Endozoicomonas gorgoniicola TaxID=1234144 RepID=A0ABT3MX78_9GAMM|nr:IS1 family transposase [Endozoicomonas gorgoniicola]MCW7553974.1 IS1 family transposase [Endozoicomonas gorgoniicola]